MKVSYIRWGFGFLIGWQLMTVLYNVVLAKWDWVVFDMACAAIVACSWMVTERSLAGIRETNRRNAEQIAHFKGMLDASRLAGDERSEQYALTMLSIWGWKGDH